MTTGHSGRQEKIMEFVKQSPKEMVLEIQLRHSNPHRQVATHVVLKRTDPATG
jgi:hypothetical protein